ncbi:MAG: winged helix-turn-helix domain-containing protein [Rhizobacter sp.]|nr:winged helix-turn-helix domain-containing protein [Chlorobiales bacterium]
MKKNIARPQLIAVLNRLFDSKLCTLTAPAGYGKSTLLGAFKQSHPKSQIATAALTPRDARPEVFILTLIDALRKLYPDFGDTLRLRLESLTQPLTAETVSDAASQFVRLCEKVFDDEVILIIDDYHATESNPAVAAFMRYVAEYSGDLLKLIIASRYAVDFERARFAAQGNLIELTEEDLRLSEDETAEVMKLGGGAGLPEGLQKSLYQKTRGWAACTVLARDLLGGESEARQAKLIERLDASQKLHGFIMEEIFRRQPNALQRAMASLAVPESFDLPLARWLTGDANIDAAATQLLTRNLLTETNGKLEFHSLVRAFLLQKLTGDERTLLCERLAEVLRRNGDQEKAIEYWLQARDIESVLNAIESKIEPPDRRRLELWTEELQALPLTAFQYQRVILLYAFSLSDRDHTGEVARLAAAARTYFIEVEPGGIHHVRASVLMLLFALKRGASDEASRLFDEIVQHTDASTDEIKLTYKARAMLLMAMMREDAVLLGEALKLQAYIKDETLLLQIYLQFARLYRKSFNAPALLGTIAEIEQRLPRARNPLLRIIAMGTLAIANAALGNFSRSKKLADAGLQLCEDTGYEGGAKANFYTALRVFYASAARPKQALHYSDEVIRMYQTDFKIGYLGELIWRAQYEYQLGDMASVLQRIATVQGLYAATGEEAQVLIDEIFLDTQTFALLASGDVARAETLMQGALAEVNVATVKDRLRQLAALMQLCLLFSPLRKNAPEKFERYAALLLERLSGSTDLFDYTFLKDVSQSAGQVLEAAAMNASLLARFGDELRRLRHVLAAHQQDIAEILGETEAVAGSMDAIKIEVCTFGRFSVRAGGRELQKDDWGRKKPRDVFKVLLLNHAKAVTTDELLNLLWDDAPTKSAELVLLNSISRLRKALEPDLEPHKPSRYLTNRDKTYTLDLGGEAVIDFLVFKNAVAAARHAASEDEKLRHYAEAVALYGGDFLKEDYYEDWTAFERETLKDACIEALEHLAASALQQGDVKAAAGTAEKILDIDRTSERAYELLITCRLSQNNMADAQKIFERCKAAFKKELGLAPPKRLRDLLP